MQGLGERLFQAEGAAGAGAPGQTGAGMFGNRKSGLGQGGVRSGGALGDRTGSRESCRSWYSSSVDLALLILGVLYIVTLGNAQDAQRGGAPAPFVLCVAGIWVAPGCALRCSAIRVLSQERVEARGRPALPGEAWHPAGGGQSWLARVQHETGHETAVSAGGPGGLGEGLPTHLPWYPRHRADPPGDQPVLMLAIGRFCANRKNATSRFKRLHFRWLENCCNIPILLGSAKCWRLNHCIRPQCE